MQRAGSSESRLRGFGFKDKIGIVELHLWCFLLADKYPQLAHPPLREALVDIKVRDELPNEWVENLANVEFEGFETSQRIKVGTVKFEIPGDRPPSAAASAQVLGRRYDQTDGERVLQVRRNGMTLSILKNYQKWEALRAAAQGLWGSYLRIAGAVHVDRLAVRYINAIEMRLGDDCDKYLTAAPQIPRKLPQILNNFIQRVEVPFDERAVAIITQTLGPPIESKGSAILDIDVFCSCSLEGNSPEIWLRLDDLRDIANDVFFSSITQEVLESYL